MDPALIQRGGLGTIERRELVLLARDRPGELVLGHPRPPAHAEIACPLVQLVARVTHHVDASERLARPVARGAPATRRMGNDNGWKFADLNLSYWAVSGLNCGQGRVLVQTSTFVDLAERAMAGDGQPTM